MNADEQQQLALRNRKFQTKLVYQELIEEFFDWESDKDLWEEYSPKRLRDMLEIKNDDVRFGKALTTGTGVSEKSWGIKVIFVLPCLHFYDERGILSLKIIKHRRHIK